MYEYAKKNESVWWAGRVGLYHCLQCRFESHLFLSLSSAGTLPVCLYWCSIAVSRLVGRGQAASCKVKVKSSIVEPLLSYHNDSSLNGTAYLDFAACSLHSSNQPANCNSSNVFVSRIDTWYWGLQNLCTRKANPKSVKRSLFGISSGL